MSQAAQPVLDMTLAPKAEPVSTVSQTLAVIERMACDPSADVDKLDRLMQMHERVMAREAESQFNAAMTDAQRAMGPIVARGWNPETKSKYRKYEDIDRVIRPIYTEHGFAMSFGTEPTDRPDEIRVTCRVSHRAGHARDYAVNVPADGKGIKGGVFMTRTHATGSGLTYGKRYLADLIWNLAMTEDDDGNRAGKTSKYAEAPEGYADWLSAFVAKADEGLSALTQMWQTANRDPQLKPFAEYLAKTDPKGLAALKARAREVKG
jgi:hypothetical protein